MLSGQKRSKRGVGKIEDPASALAISILALLLVTYVPTIYQAYTSREAFLTSFDRNRVATVGTFVLAACSVAGGARSRERFDCFAGQRGAVALAALTASLTTQLPSCGTYGSIA